MRQLTFIEPGKLEWWDVPAPLLMEAGDALVRPIAVARCDLDFYIFNGHAPLPGPFAFGHETIGRVIETGDAVLHFQPGDIVSVPFQISCGTCSNCLKGFTNACLTVPTRSCFGMMPLCGVEYGGALADLMRVPFADHMLVRKPENVSATALASGSDNIPDGWRAVAEPLKANPGAEVLILGGDAQSVGLYAVTAAVALGAKRVVYVDQDPVRLRIAREAGAEVREMHITGDVEPTEFFPITVDASSNQDALRFGIRSTVACGVMTCIAIYYEDLVTMPMLGMYGKGITFHTGRVHARANMPEVFDQVACGHMHPECVTTLEVPFDQAIDAMGHTGPKVIFTNDQI